MQKFVFLMLVLPILFCSSISNVIDCFCEAKMITFYKDGQQILLNESEQSQIDQLFSEAIDQSFSMPAFGVSIDNITKDSMKSGVWIEFIFDKTFYVNEMPFDSLLVNITQDQYGINIIRGNNGIYEGRCFYLDLNGKNFNELYNYLINLNNHGENFEIESQELEKTEIIEEKNDKKEKDLIKSQKSLLEKLN